MKPSPTMQQIAQLLALGLSARKIITRHLKYGPASSLSYYIATRKLGENLNRSARSTAG
jgi:hypothetical protein